MRESASWNLGLANCLGILAGLPGGQRALSLAPGVEALGAAAGPMVAAVLLSTNVRGSVPLVAGVALAAALMLFFRLAPKRSAVS